MTNKITVQAQSQKNKNSHLRVFMCVFKHSSNDKLSFWFNTALRGVKLVTLHCMVTLLLLVPSLAEHMYLWSTSSSSSVLSFQHRPTVLRNAATSQSVLGCECCWVNSRGVCDIGLRTSAREHVCACASEHHCLRCLWVSLLCVCFYSTAQPRPAEVTVKWWEQTLPSEEEGLAGRRQDIPSC